MAYMEKEGSREVILVVYYNVLFFLIFKVGLDEYKKNILIDRINSEKKMMMKDIYGWCRGHEVPFEMKYIYRRDFSIAANIWNLYSYIRFKWGILKEKYT